MAKRNSTPERRSAQEKFLFKRQLKVRQSYYSHQYHSPSYRLAYKPPKPVPWVEIKGYWLNKAGFNIGTPLSVEVKQGCIVLKTQPSPC